MSVFGGLACLYGSVSDCESSDNLYAAVGAGVILTLKPEAGVVVRAEIGDQTGLFQPAHGSAPDIMGEDRANPLAAILSGALMLDYLAHKTERPALVDAALLIEAAVSRGFEENRIRPHEFGGDMGTLAVTRELLALL
ncbi:MAG: hypothetical protein GY785_03210 [Gammaproteobacteria bacterium]|nr:hypothetical protein [Gammaproteobacteria bacterium]